MTPIGLTDSFKKEKKKKRAQESIGLISGNKKEKKEREKEAYQEIFNPVLVYFVLITEII